LHRRLVTVDLMVRPPKVSAEPALRGSSMPLKVVLLNDHVALPGTEHHLHDLAKCAQAQASSDTLLLT